MTKYNASKVVIDGYTFDSQAEGRRYGELKLLEQAGHVRELCVHPVYPLVVNEKKVGTYIADFAYFGLVDPNWKVAAEYRRVVEDVKGVKTPIYRLKKKLVKALYDIDIVEVTA